MWPPVPTGNRAPKGWWISSSPVLGQSNRRECSRIGVASSHSPSLPYTAGGTAIATFTIASTERWKNGAGEPQEHTEWFNIKAFGKRAEVVAEHIHKGSRIFLEGRQRTESWDDKQSGDKKYMTFVYADKVEFLGESQRDRQEGGLMLDQSYSQEDPTMITDADVLWIILG